LRLPKQRNTGNWIGAGYTYYTSGSIFINPVQQFMGASTFFMVFLSKLLPDVVLWQFYIGLAVIYFIFMYLGYTIANPSLIAFGNSQSYAHENPIRADLEYIKEHLKIIEAKLP
jgi:hypothetical protein